ncbi:MAG: Ig-like domain-containing protein [Saprospiraceae bacterium]|nr:Ig-like domain-containing protein [Saprospiraceae bacterium]
MRKACCLFFLVLVACARPIAPVGGPKDVEPPKLVIQESTPNFSTGFRADRIELTFDEWVVLSDLAQQVVISPPLPGKKSLPNISLKGKTVTIRLAEDQTLRPNTTYTINMGSSVRDLHEGNPARDLRFVFSTGDYIDSLSASGIVVDAFTGAPMENATAMLYENTVDSAVILEKPFYFTRSDKSGRFQLQNMRPGMYRCIVIEDAVPNLRWDGVSERIGYAEQLLIVSDTSTATASVRLFQEEPPLRVINRDTSTYGRVGLKFNAPTDGLLLRADDPALTLLTEYTGDSIAVWYTTENGDSWNLIAGRDTVRVPAHSKSGFLEQHKPGWYDPAAADRNRFRKFKPQEENPSPPPPPTVSQNPLRPAALSFNAPVAVWDTALWQLLLDSSLLPAPRIRADSARPRNLIVEVPWVKEKAHRLTLLPGAITDIWGATNTDTLKIILNVLSEKTLSTLNLSVAGLTPGDAYVLEIVDAKTVVEKRPFVASGPSQSFLFPGIDAKTYTLRLIEDRNKNGRWDPGHFLQKRQPEVVRTKNLPALRANWEVEETF